MTANPRLIVGINVVLILVLASTLAQMTWWALPAPEPLPMPASNASSTASVKVRPPSVSAAAELPRWHLFGRANAVVAAPKQENIPETKLKLTLRGLLASDDPNDAWAIVADPSGRENFYKVGASLPGNAQLEEIHADRIVLERRGRFETLRLPKKSLDLNTTNTRTSSARSVSSSSSNVSLRDFRDTLMKDPQRVTDLVSIAPVRKRGKFVGYSLQPGRNADFLQSQGLQPGDIVTRVNGVALDNPAKGLGVLRDLASADSLNIEVERNGRRQSFTLPIN